MTYTPSPAGEEPIDYSMDEPLYEVQETMDEAQTQPVVAPMESPTGAAEAETTTEGSDEAEEPTGTGEPMKPYEYYAPSGMTRAEYSRLKMKEFEGFNDFSATALAGETAFKGVADTVSDTVSFFTGGNVKIPKFDKYDNQAQQAAREISGFLIPELVGVGMVRRLGQIAHARVGWNIGNNPWVRRISQAGIEVGVPTVISAAKEETKEAGNVFNLAANVMNKLPGNWDWIAKDLGTFQGQDPDLIRQKNIQADGILMGGIPIIGGIAAGLSKLRGATKLSVSTADLAVDGLEITGNTAKSKAALAKLDPKAQFRDKSAADIWDANELDSTWDDLPDDMKAEVTKLYDELGYIPERTGVPEELIVDWALDQDSALDELGRYNLSKFGEQEDVALKGVHDLFEYNEVGMRTVDDLGIFGAAIDQARIANNAGTTMGRLRNMISPAAKKYVVDNLAAADDITLGFAKNLEDIDDVSVAGEKWSLSMDDILKAGDDLVVDFFDPTLDVNGIKRILGKNIKTLDDGTEVLMSGGYGDLMNQIVKMGKEFNSMDIAKAQAYVGTSLSGQLSDAAEMARLHRDSPIVIEAAQERILDNMKYLMRLKGSTNYYRNLKSNMANMFDTVSAAKTRTPEQLREGYKDAMRVLEQEINQFADELSYSFKQYPELGEAIMELYELTDGRVYGIETINETLKKSFGSDFLNPFKGADPDMPNLVGQTVRANWFNSVLSAVGTPMRAFVGNIGGIVEEPISYFAGALARGDMDSMQKGMYAYRSFGDIRTKALPLMGDLFRKASQRVEGVELATDLDYSLAIDKKINSLRALGAAEADRGNLGIQLMVDEVTTLYEMAQHPALKFSSNLMTGMDGLPQSMVANAEARFKAIELAKREGITDPQKILDIANAEYDKMFKGGQLQKGTAAKYGADRIALRADTPLAQSINEMTKKFPWTRMFFPFPGTQANIFNLVDETIPMPFRSFQRDINELAYTSMTKFQENPLKMREILERKGFDVDAMSMEDQLSAIVRLKNKTVGRKAISTFMVGSFSALYFNGRVTGEGIYDQQAQASREKNAKIPRNSIMGPDGRWYSYMDILGPGYGRWVSTVVTAYENANYLGAGNMENITKKLAVTLGGILEEDSGLSALQPMLQMAEGNAYAGTRWSAGMLNSLGPLSGLRNELGNILNGGLRIVDNDIKSMMANRNKALGLVIPDADLPKLTNPLDGTVPNEYNPIMRIFNTYSPVKMTSKASENGLFLNDIGYSYTTMFKQHKGVDLEPSEREALFKLVAEDGQFNRDVTRIRKRAEKIGYINALREAKANGATGEELEGYLQLQKGIRDSAKLAEEMAFVRLENKYKQAIYDRVQEQNIKQQRSEIGAQSFIEQVPTR